MNLNEFKQEVHALAMEKGFYDPEPSDAELIAAIHSEISEAFEEWRDNQPMVRHDCDRCYRNINRDEPCDGIDYETEQPCPLRGNEPHGIAVELIDVVLRILDAAATWGVNLKQWNLGSHVEQFTVPKLFCELHSNVAHIYHRRKVDVSSKVDANSEAFETSVAYPLILIFTWLRARDIDPEALMLEKHRYNITRPYKHGGKRV